MLDDMLAKFKRNTVNAKEEEESQNLAQDGNQEKSEKSK